MTNTLLRIAGASLISSTLFAVSFAVSDSTVLTHTWESVVSPIVSEEPAPSPAPDVAPLPEEKPAAPDLIIPDCELEDGSSQGGTCYRFGGGENGVGVDYIIVDGRTFYTED